LGNAAGVRRDFEALEQRRFEAIRLVEQEGLSQAEVGRRLKLARQTVARRMQEYRRHGNAGLKKAGRAGRKPLLGAAGRQRLVEYLRQGPERLGYQTPLWTCPRVAHLIEEEFGVKIHEGHVWKALVALGWSPQRPAGKARERNESLIRDWQRKQWPAIKTKPASRAAPSSASTRAD
jgi:transposase